MLKSTIKSNRGVTSSTLSSIELQFQALRNHGLGFFFKEQFKNRKKNKFDSKKDIIFFKIFFFKFKKIKNYKGFKCLNVEILRGG